jgi:hypothetical protein
MTKNLAEVVRELVDSYPYLKDGLSLGVVNYSAMARKLREPIVKKVGKNVNEETIIVALRRYADSLAKEGSEPISSQLKEIISKSTMSLRDDIICFILNRSPVVLKALQELYNKIEWEKGEFMFLICGIGEIMVVVDSINRSKVEELVENEIVDRFDELATVTVRSPMDVEKIPGFLHHFAEKTSDRGISIEIVSTARETHFIVNRKDAMEVYKIFKETIDRARESE